MVVFFSCGLWTFSDILRQSANTILMHAMLPVCVPGLLVAGSLVEVVSACDTGANNSDKN
ncbi:MAG: hypothetical protein V7459_00185 [Oceanicoccus sp.]